MLTGYDMLSVSFLVLAWLVEAISSTLHETLASISVSVSTGLAQVTLAYWQWSMADQLPM